MLYKEYEKFIYNSIFLKIVTEVGMRLRVSKVQRIGGSSLYALIPKEVARLMNLDENSLVFCQPMRKGNKIVAVIEKVNLGAYKR